MASDFPLGFFSRPSDHGPDAPAATWECPCCGCGYTERPADAEMTRCSEPGCGEPEGTWIGPCCRESAECDACAEPYCAEHLKDVVRPPGDVAPYFVKERWCASCIKDSTCPRCGELKDDIEEYDFGVDRETGYHDAGRACGDCLKKRSRS